MRTKVGLKYVELLKDIFKQKDTLCIQNGSVLKIKELLYREEDKHKIKSLIYKHCCCTFFQNMKLRYVSKG